MALLSTFLSIAAMAAILAGSASSGIDTGSSAQIRHWPFGGLGAAIGAGPQATTAVVLHFNGNPDPGNLAEDASCTGDGDADVLVDDCSNLITGGAGTLSTGPAAHWDPPNPALNGSNARNIYDPNFLWILANPTVLSGAMTVEWWASCGLCGPTFNAQWNLRIWIDANGQTGIIPAFQEIVTATPALPNVPSKLTATVTLPTLAASSNVILHVDPVFVDSQQLTHIYYDSELPCPGATAGPCDSTVSMPVVTTAVQLLGFAARADRNRVVLRWRTGAENGLAGFNVWRLTPSGKTKLHRSPIRARGNTGGSRYSFVDRTARRGTSYTYRLQVVERNGSTSWHGSARVRTAR